MPQLNSGATPNLADIARALGGAGTPMPEGGEDWLKEHAPQVDFSALLPDEREEYAYYYPDMTEPARRAMWGRSQLTHEQRAERHVYLEETVYSTEHPRGRPAHRWTPPGRAWSLSEDVDLVPFNALA